MPDDPTTQSEPTGAPPQPGLDPGGQSAPTFFQLTDALTDRRFSVRIDPEDAALPMKHLLVKYVQRCPVDAYIADSRLTSVAADALSWMQENLYHLSDSGEPGPPIDGPAFHQQGRYIDADESPAVARVMAGITPIRIIDVTVDRNAVGFHRNWVGFHRRRWNRYPSTFTDFIVESLEAKHAPAQAKRIANPGSDEDKVLLVRALAGRIWDADFENYSRFTGDALRYKTGDEAVLNIQAGRGGICSEKVQALKFLTDACGLESEYVLVGPEIPEPPPEDILRQLLETFDFSFAKRHMRYWQHVALLYQLDEPLLVDATNGNIPFLFEQGDRASRYLGYDKKKSLAVKMAIIPENFYYHRTSQDLVQNLYYAMEHFIPEIDLVQVFDNELGLYIDHGVLVAPFMYRTDSEYEALRADYATACHDQGLPCETTPDWTLEGRLGEELSHRNPVAAQAILGSQHHLIDRYDHFEGEGHSAGLAVIGLSPSGP